MNQVLNEKITGIWALKDKETGELLRTFDNQLITFADRESARDYARDDGYGSTPVYSKVNFKARS